MAPYFRFNIPCAVTTTSTTSTTTTATPITFAVSASNSQCVPDGLSTAYPSVRTSNNDATLADASANGSALYRMPQNQLLTGFDYVKDATLGDVYFLNSSTAVVGSTDTNC